MGSLASRASAFVSSSSSCWSHAAPPRSSPPWRRPGCSVPLLDGVPQPRRVGRLVALVPQADAMLRLAALAAIVPEDAARLRERLRLSNADALRLEAATTVLTHLHGDRRPPDEHGLRVLLFRHARQATVDGVTLAFAEAGGDEDRWRAALSFAAEAAQPVLPFTGKTLIAHGIAPGKPLGEALRRLSESWAHAGFPQDPQSLAALLAASDQTRYIAAAIKC